MTWKDLYNKANFYEIEKEFYEELKNYIANDLRFKIDISMKLNNYKEIIILGIGTNISEWANFDTFGPRVGSLLKQYNLPEYIKCYGDMDETLNATNIASFAQEMKKELEEKMVIAIDSSISNRRSLGSITIYNHGLKPGAGFKKKLPKLGDLSILGNTVEKTYNLFNLSREQINSLSISINKLEELVNITTESLSIALSKDDFVICKDKIIRRY